MSEKPIALVTGGNRGLGFEICRKLALQGYKVILSSRSVSKGIKKAAELDEEGLDVFLGQLDVSNPNSIARMYELINKQWGRLDVLINNAAIFIDGYEQGGHSSSLFRTSKEVLMRTYETNVVGAYMLCDAFLPLMIAQNFGRVINVSSEAGQLENMKDGYPAYRISKTAINAVTRIFAAQAKGYNVLVNSVDPGWVKTDMGGANAPLSIEEGVDTIIWACNLPEGGPSGCFFNNRNKVPW